MSRPDRTRPAGLRSPLHAVVHLVLVVLGWAGFVWLWSLVLGRPWESADLRGLIVGTLVVAPTLTVAWIVHNVGIYRRRGPRRSVPAVTWRYERDYNGREVVADFVALRDARAVVIDVDGGRKRFRVVAEPAGREREVAHG